jgi:hypothetical protein
MRPAFLLAAGLLLLNLPAAAAAERVGDVARVRGECIGASEGETRRLAAGLPVFRDEIVSTGNSARLLVRFLDGSNLTLGENARVEIDEFVYRPDGPGALIGAAIVGPFRFISGKLSLNPKTVRTAFGTIALPGDGEVVAGPVDGEFGILLVSGTVDIVAGGIPIALRRPGDGVSIAAPGDRPGAVTAWPAAKVARALAATAF